MQPTVFEKEEQPWDAGRDRSSSSILRNLPVTQDGRSVSPLAGVFRASLPPVTVFSVVMAISPLDRSSPEGAYILLAVFTAALAAPIFGGTSIIRPSLRNVLHQVPSVLAKWAVIVSCLAAVGLFTNAYRFFSLENLYRGALLTPLSVLAAQMIVSSIMIYWVVGRRAPRKAVIVGANTLGMALRERVESAPLLGMSVNGFFDDRTSPRIPRTAAIMHLGRLDELPQYVKNQAVDAVYICLPIVWHTRIRRLLEGLADTTASVYYVPDIYMHELLQTRVVYVAGVPTLAIVDSPFHGADAILKRGMDLVLSLVALIAFSPVILFCAIGVRLSSPGPVIFRQTRYGVNGQPIVVLKFRIMYVNEDSAEVRQAIRGDPRVTTIGGFLRRTSLDELPQLFNVLKGDMSLVGPRPHAVEHNEMYRKVISRYMVRHKVKPGITGLAQVRGLRGETATIDKMAARVECDLEYINNWSLALDLSILLRTLKLVISDRAAF